MLARFHKAQEERDGGFTLIELLVVMIIIGILAAIAIPVFLNQRNKAKDTSIKADVTTVGKDLASYYVDGTLTTAVATAAGQWTITPAGAAAPSDSGRVSNGNTITGAGNGDSDWCVKGTNADTGTVYFYSASAGLSSARPGDSSCAGL